MMIWGSWPSRSSCFQFCPWGADGPRGVGGQSARSKFVRCSSCSCFVSFWSGFVLGFRCSRFADGPSFSRGRSVARADGPPGLRGRSVFLGSVLVVLFALTDGTRLRTDSQRQGCGQSAGPCWTVRATIADSLPCLAGRSARGWQLCFLVRFLPSFLVLPRVLQGLVPKTRGWSITSLSWRLACDSIHRLCVTGNCLGYRPGSLRRIFTGSYSLPPSLVAIWSFIMWRYLIRY
jgi:hypothetical protein